MRAPRLIDAGGPARPARVAVVGPFVDAGLMAGLIDAVTAAHIQVVEGKDDPAPAIPPGFVAAVTVAGYPEAVKEVEDGSVRASVDRSSLLLAGPPLTAETAAMRACLRGRAGPCHLVEALVETGAAVAPAGSGTA